MFERLGRAESRLLVSSDRRGDEGPGFLENVPYVVLMKSELEFERLLEKLDKGLQSGRESSR